MLYDSASRESNPRLSCLYICPVAIKDDQRIGHASADTQRGLGNGSRL